MHRETASRYRVGHKTNVPGNPLMQVAQAESTSTPAGEPTWIARVARLAAFGLALLAAVISLAYIWVRPFPFDALAYWVAWPNGLYGKSGVLAGFLYAPAFGQLIYPLTLLPFDVFRVVWAAIALVVYAWLLAPLGPRLSIPLLVACLPIVANGNTEFILALVAVLGFSRPASWSAVLLTKVTPAVALLWFAVRREWRALAVAFGVTLLIAIASAAIAPHLWTRWFSLLLTNAATPPLPFPIPQPRVLYRLPIAALLVIWGALSGRRWVVPVAMLIATPDILVTSYGMLAALPRLWGMPAAQPARPIRALPLVRPHRHGTRTTIGEG
jgi:hypothetical protein